MPFRQMVRRLGEDVQPASCALDMPKRKAIPRCFWTCLATGVRTPARAPRHQSRILMRTFAIVEKISQ